MDEFPLAKADTAACPLALRPHGFNISGLTSSCSKDNVSIAICRGAWWQSNHTSYWRLPCFWQSQINSASQTEHNDIMYDWVLFKKKKKGRGGIVEINVPKVRARGRTWLRVVYANPSAVLSAGQPSCVLLDKQMSWRIRDRCHGPDGKSPICSLTWRLCLHYVSICVYSCPGVSWKWLLDFKISEPPQGHFLPCVGSVTLPPLQLATYPVFIKLHGEKHKDYRAESHHPAGPVRARETGTQHKGI